MLSLAPPLSVATGVTVISNIENCSRRATIAIIQKIAKCYLIDERELLDAYYRQEMIDSGYNPETFLKDLPF